MTGLRTQIKRHPLGAYFVIAYAISWGIWAPLVVGVQGGSAGATLLIMAGGFGPALAGLKVAWICEGRGGVRRWAGRILRWRVALGWYLVVLFGLLVLDLPGVRPIPALRRSSAIFREGRRTARQPGWRRTERRPLCAR